MKIQNTITKSQVEKEIKSLVGKMNYQDKKLNEEKISYSDYLEKLREISRPLNILEVILAIENSMCSLKNLRQCYLNLLNLGSPENFYINRIANTNTGEEITSNLNQYDRIRHEVVFQIIDCFEQVKKDLKGIKITDLLQETINEMGMGNE